LLLFKSIIMKKKSKTISLSFIDLLKLHDEIINYKIKDTKTFYKIIKQSAINTIHNLIKEIDDESEIKRLDEVLNYFLNNINYCSKLYQVIQLLILTNEFKIDKTVNIVLFNHDEYIHLEVPLLGNIVEIDADSIFEININIFDTKITRKIKSQTIRLIFDFLDELDKELNKLIK